ncbi:MAG TPA: hypothetical protein PKC87_04455 [Candidatus Absconditabacterales bacterium]|nr:hypothetical protein [Candidatus Absconditabacterales bacterium]
MYKRVVGIGMAFALCMTVGISVYAQTGEAEPTIQVQAFSNLRVRHCDDGLESEKLTTKSSLTLDGNETKTLCNVFINDSNVDITVKYTYVEASIGNSGLPNCSINGGKFAALISTPEPTSFVIPAKSHIVRKDNMFLPPGMNEGIIRGCLGYGIESIKGIEDKRVEMFKIENRKVILYEVLIGGVANIKNAVSLEAQKSNVFITNKNIKVLSNTGGGLVISATIKNSGNVDQIVNLTGEIRNFLGFEKIFSIKDKKIGPFQTVELPIDINNIPSYKGIFDVKMTISYVPSLSFEGFDLPEEVLKGGSFYETGKFFIFSRYAVAVLAIVLLILRAIIKSIIPRKKQA